MRLKYLDQIKSRYAELASRLSTPPHEGRGLGEAGDMTSIIGKSVRTHVGTMILQASPSPRQSKIILPCNWLPIMAFIS